MVEKTLEQNRPAGGWFRLIYVVYGIIFFTIIGGFVQILDLADHLNFALVKFLEKNPDGPALHGTYLYPKNWLAAALLLLSLLLVFPAMTLLRHLVNNKEADKEASDGESRELEIIALRQDLDDAMHYADNIVQHMYPRGEPCLPRFSITEVWTRYDVDINGDTTFEQIFQLNFVGRSREELKL